MQLRRRMLEGFEQRTRAAEHHDVGAIVEARPADRFFLDEVDCEVDIHRRLEPSAGHFAFALTRVAVTHEQQRTRLINGEHQLHAGVQSGVIHVAAVRARRDGRDRFLARRCHGNTSQHRLERKLEDRRLQIR